jgi:cytochrome c biogenesis protein CcmG, thiol:disulfide interchange protein DsbE
VSRAKAKVHWPILIGGLLVVGLSTWALAMGFGSDPNTIDSPLIDQPAPAFELPRLADGALIQRSSLEGKPVVINFWATWCASCPMEHPYLVRAAQEFEGRATFVGVAHNDKNEAISRWLRKNGGATYPTLVDINGKAAIAYGVYGVPETYVLDKDGVVRFKHTGPIDPRALRQQLQGLL